MVKPIFSLAGKRVWVAGHHGMVGSALVRRLNSERVDLVVADREAVDLRRQADVEAWMANEKPDVVFVAAAKVGGIAANDNYPATFLYDNVMIEANVIDAAKKIGVEKLVLLGSTCIYPRLAPQPIPEEALMTGPLEPTNEWYAIAKIVGIKLCQAHRRQYGCDFISAQPTNLYGPGDNFDLEAAHVLPALMHKAHDAKREGRPSITVWGSGTSLRAFLHVDDCADALVFLAKHYSGETQINIGSGEELSIQALAEMICDIVGFEGKLVFDRSRSDGTPRKLSDVRRLHRLGWKHRISLRRGIFETYRWFVESVTNRLAVRL